MTTLYGYKREVGQPGARNNVLVLPSVICSALVAREIAEAAGVCAVAHQHGCGHIGPDIVQTQDLFVGAASSPNVAHPLVVSLGCETIQGRGIADRLRAKGIDARFVSIQDSGGSTAARAAGIREATELRQLADGCERVSVPVSGLTVGVAVDRADHRVADLIGHAVRRGARVVVAGPRAAVAGLTTGAASIAIGEAPAEQISFLGEDPGSPGARLLALASTRTQVIVEFPAVDQPPLSIAVAPMVSVAAAESVLHQMIGAEFDLGAGDDVGAIWECVGEVFSGAPAKSELRNSTTFSIPRLLRTM
ncbi:UxaA family hydrolase [Gordonia sp. CPCC 205515]|uniref:UxaA family hydrolase n=1 Tax=Gordonia sp. CPCC 205515 TaxID=3140791 RepID=UPI003AF3597F